MITRSLYRFAVAVGVMLLAVCVFPAASAFAGGTHAGTQITAQEVEAANNSMDATRNFVLHARAHYQAAVLKGSTQEIALFLKDLKKAPWVSDSGSTYVIYMDADLPGTVRIHPKDNKRLHGAVLDNFKVVKSLRAKAEKSRMAATFPQQGEAVCEQYDLKGTMRWACAAPFYIEVGKIRASFLFLAGFDHDVDDPNVIPIQCPDYERPSTTAEDVEKMQDRETLKKFVQGASKVFKENPPGTAKAGVLNCFFVDKALKSGSVYVFIMTSQTTVFINGHNLDLLGSSFTNIIDEDGVDISKEILKVATADGVGGFVEYKWDNPSVMGDEVDEPGKAAGVSPKVTYVEGVDIGAGAAVEHYIIGSGYYPKAGTDMPKTDSSDTGCAIAGAGADSGSSAFGLFLAVFSVCLVFCMRSRERK